jgi:hypothetical protein
MNKTQRTFLAIGFGLFASSGLQAKETFIAPQDLSQVKPQQLCVNYLDQSEAEKKRFYDRLHDLGMLSHKDYEMMKEGKVVVGSSMCGMYMTKGRPLHEEGRQIRPLVFKVVHIYPEHYIVTQSGMVMEIYDRIEGQMPPSLVTEVPKVAPPPLNPK